MSDILQAARSYYGLADTDVRKTDIYTNEAGQPMLVFELALSDEDFIAIGARMKNMQQPDTQPDTAVIEGPTVESMREAYNALSKAEKGRYGSFSNFMKDDSWGIVTDRSGDKPVHTIHTYADKNEEYPALQAHLDSIVEEAKNRPLPENPDALTGDGCPGFERRTGLMLRTDGSVYQWDGKSNVKDPVALGKLVLGEHPPIGERQVVHVDTPEKPEPTNMDAVWLGFGDVTIAQMQFASDSRNTPAHGNEYLIQWAMLTDEQKQKAKP